MTAVSLPVWRTELHLDVRADVDADVLMALLRGRVVELELAASRFRPDSEVSLLRRRAGRWTQVSPLLLHLLQVAMGAARATEGVVHPGLGAVVAAAGYDRWAGSSAAEEPAGVLPWHSIEVDPGGAVRVPPGMVIDLGATAKAWLADSLATTLVEATGAPALANMGGDIRAISHAEPWNVWLDPELPSVPPVPVTVADAGIATSGVGRRSWRGGHHIIDPGTGAPARTCWRSVSVVAADAVGANAAATAAVVLGEAAEGWLERQRLTAWLVGHSGTATQIGWRDAA